MRKIILAASLVMASLATSSTSHARDQSCGDISCSKVNDAVRRCWVPNHHAPELNKMYVDLTVALDPSGRAFDAKVAEENQQQFMADPLLKMFADKAIKATLNPRCAHFPFPRSMLGVETVITLRFHP
jgi:hypothetical protein